MTLPEPGVVIDLDGLRQQIAELISREAKIKVTFDSVGRRYEHVTNSEELASEALALIERLRALEGGGGEGVTSAREPSHTHNAAREADASTLVSEAGWRPYDKFAVSRGDEVWVRARAGDNCTSCLFVYVERVHGDAMSGYVRPADVLLPLPAPPSEAG